MQMTNCGARGRGALDSSIGVCVCGERARLKTVRSNEQADTVKQSWESNGGDWGCGWLRLER